MKKITIIVTLLVLALSYSASGQEIQTLFRTPRPSGGYGVLSNKFTSINGQYANLAEVYGGWFIKRRFFLGLGGAASTNDIRVPVVFSTSPSKHMTWQYGQFGMMTEYVFGSNKVIHFNVTLFGGGGFTLQYERSNWDQWDDYDQNRKNAHDENFFYVMEPGAQVELNLFKWLRLSPGVSYRKTFGSEGIGLGDNEVSDWSYNVSLKIGKF